MRITITLFFFPKNFRFCCSSSYIRIVDKTCGIKALTLVLNCPLHTPHVRPNCVCTQPRAPILKCDGLSSTHHYFMSIHACMHARTHTPAQYILPSEQWWINADHQEATWDALTEPTFFRVRLFFSRLLFPHRLRELPAPCTSSVELQESRVSAPRPQRWHRFTLTCDSFSRALMQSDF